jgi:hypothetical protein
MRQHWTVLHGQPPEHPDATVELVAVEIESGQTVFAEPGGGQQEWLCAEEPTPLEEAR